MFWLLMLSVCRLCYSGYSFGNVWVCFGYSCSQCAVCVTQGTVLVTFGYVLVTHALSVPFVLLSVQFW